MAHLILKSNLEMLLDLFLHEAVREYTISHLISREQS